MNMNQPPPQPQQQQQKHSQLNPEQISYLRSSIHYAITESSARGLLHCAKWLGEQLVGLPIVLSGVATQQRSSNRRYHHHHHHHRSSFDEYEMTNIFSTTQLNKNNKTIGNNMNDDHVDDLDDDDECYLWQDKYHFAKSLFDLKEYDRCAHVLSSSSTTSASLSSHHMSNKSENGLLQLKNSKLNRKVLFLSFYARYLSGEQAKERHKLEQKAQKIVNQSGNNGATGGGGAKLTGFAVKTTLENSKNSKLLQLSNELSVLYERTMRPPQQSGVELVQMDAYLFYLYAIVLKELKATQRAILMLIESVTRNPLLWSSWHEIVTILQTNVTTSNSIMSNGNSSSGGHGMMGNGSVNMTTNHQAPVTMSPVEVFQQLNQKFRQYHSVMSDDANQNGGGGSGSTGSSGSSVVALKKNVFIIVRELFRAKLQIEACFSQTGIQNQSPPLSSAPSSSSLTSSSSTSSLTSDRSSSSYATTSMSSTFSSSTAAPAAASSSSSSLSDQTETAPATSITFEQVAQSLIAIKNQVFPNSLYIICELALTNYHLQRYDRAMELFALIRKHDPYRYEHMHTFSNIYFIRNMKRELSVLGHELHKTHKYKPETCCILGNYYSMRNEHERAVIYFKRALQLNPLFLSAWTLMGHEYVEMKNTTAAVSAYRTAVDIQPRDYRAWYGLGQTYELLSMPHYALYYFSKACSLRPYDGRMWGALAGCYEALSQYRDALRCYQRSRENGEQVKSLIKMGDLYRKMGDDAQAAHFYTTCINLQQCERDRVILGDEVEPIILLFLVKYHMRGVKPPDFEQAKMYCLRLLQQYPTFSQRENAAQLLKDIQLYSNTQ